MIEEIRGDFFQWLRGFYYVAKTGSVSAAALEIGRRQPTVTHQIRCLEELYDVKLFEYSDQNMNLTREGKLLLDHAVSIFDEVNKLFDSISSIKQTTSGKISIACPHALTMYYLAKFISDFTKKMPNVEFDIKGGMMDTISEEVFYGNCDFGVVYLDSVEQKFAMYTLFQTSVSLITNSGNPYNISKEPCIEEISKLPFIYYPPQSTIKALVDSKFAEAGFGINKIMVLNHFESVKEFVRQGTGVSIVFDYAIVDHDRSSLSIFPLEKIFNKIDVGIITRRKKYLSPVVKSFFKTLNSGMQLG